MSDKASERSIELSDEFSNILEGEMLGDGGIYSSSPVTAKFMYGTSCRAYRDWLADRFTGEGFEVTRSDSVERGYDVYRFHTLSCGVLSAERDRWYGNRNKGSKTIADDFELSPRALRHWFIGDGTAHLENSNLYISRWQMSDHEVELIVEEFHRLEIDVSIPSSRSCVRILSSSWEDFYEHMAPLPEELEEVYGYKWAL